MLSEAKSDLNLSDGLLNSALEGNSGAMFDIAFKYASNKTIKGFQNKAVWWYKKAAEQGNTDAQCNLGFCYYKGDGVEQNYSKAVAWYTKAAEQGHAGAQETFGILGL
jgi:TPR repeat protein